MPKVYVLTILVALTAAAGTSRAQEEAAKIKSPLRLIVVDRGDLHALGNADLIARIKLESRNGAKDGIRWLIDDGTGVEVQERVIELKDGSAADLAAALAAILNEKDKKPVEKHNAADLDTALRDVINTGAKMFNDQMDYAGCYRLFQGSLLSVRPFVPKDLQGKIDAGIASAEKMPGYADRAFELRRVLDEIRATMKGGRTGDKGKTDKTDKASGDQGQVSGKLTFEGKAVAGGYFVTLVDADGHRFSSTVNKDGTFQLKTAIATGVYRVAIELIPDEKLKATAIPARYTSENTSSIVLSIQAGKQLVDLNLAR